MSSAEESLIRNFVYFNHDLSLFSERDVSEQLNVKRGQTREVLLTLAGEGLITREPLRGYRFVDYGATELDTVRMLRFMVEFEGTRLAMARHTREDMLRLLLILDDIDQAVAARDILSFSRNDYDFHAALICASHDNLLIREFSFLRKVLYRKNVEENTPVFTDQHAESQVTHRRIFDALQSRDWDALRSTLLQHLTLPPAFKELWKGLTLAATSTPTPK